MLPEELNYQFMNRLRIIIKLYKVPLLLLSALFISTQLTAGERYDRIIQNGVIKVGISQSYPPLNINANGSHTGVELEMAESLAEFLDVRLETVSLPVSEYIGALSSGRVDVLLAGLSRNLGRGSQIWFSTPYIEMTPAVLVDKRKLPKTEYGEVFEEDPFRTLWDLKRLPNFNFGVKRGSAYERLLIANFETMNQIMLKDNSQGLRYLKEGRIDGFVHDSLYLEHLVRKNPELKNRFRLLSGGDLIEQISVGLPFGDSILKTQVDFWVEELVRQKRIAGWLNRYAER